jgi:hypothetical protein
VGVGPRASARQWAHLPQPGALTALHARIASASVVLLEAAMDLCTLVRQDHDDIDHALRAMSDPTAGEAAQVEYLNVFRLAMAVHVVAECRVHESLLGIVTRPRDALRWLVAQLEREHALQLAEAEAVAKLLPGSASWVDRVLKLRIEFLAHAARQDLMRGSFEAHIGVEQRHVLASRFAFERARVLAATSPLEMARRVHAA